MLALCDDGAVVTGEHLDRLCDGTLLDGVADDLAGPLADCRTVEHRGAAVAAGREIAFELRTALRLYERVPLSVAGPDVELTLDDHTLLAWLRRRGPHVTVLEGDPGPDPRAAADD